MPVGSARKRRLRREKAAAAKAEQEAAAAAREAAGLEPQENSGFTRHKRARKDDKPEAAAQAAETTTEFKERDEVEDWITGGQAAEDNKAARKARKAKAKAEKVSSAAEADGEPEAGREEVQDNHVFVGGIPFSSTEADIRGFFEGHGCTSVAEVRIPKKDENGYARGYCHVRFDTPEDAAKAVSLSGETLGERWLQIKPALAESKYNDRGGRSSTVRTVQPAGCKTVFVRNLSFDCSDSKLSAHFERAGLTPIDVRMPNDWHTGRSKGYAYVELADMEDAASAVSKLEGTKLLGRTMHLDYEDRKQFHAGYVRPEGPAGGRRDD
jgi:RNA recognition motif-containing protein